MVASAASTGAPTGASTCTTASAFTGFRPERSRPRVKLAMLTPCSPRMEPMRADDAGHVEVAADQQVAFERRLDVDAVEFKQARLLAVNHGGRWRGLSRQPCAVRSCSTVAAPPRWLSVFSSWTRMPRSWATAAALMRFTFSEPCSSPAMAALRTSSVLASASAPP